MKVSKGQYIVLGTKGCAGVLGSLPKSIELGKAFKPHWVNVADYGSDAKTVCEQHGRGEASGFTCYDVGCYVSKRSGTKEKITILSLAEAIKRKLVTTHKVTIAFNATGKTQSVTVYALASQKWTVAKTQPQYMACFDIPSLRIETGSISKDKRNAGLLASVQADKKA